MFQQLKSINLKESIILSNEYSVRVLQAELFPTVGAAYKDLRELQVFNEQHNLKLC